MVESPTTPKGNTDLGKLFPRLPTSINVVTVDQILMRLYEFDREKFAILGDPVTSLDFDIETEDELIVSFSA